MGKQNIIYLISVLLMWCVPVFAVPNVTINITPKSGSVSDSFIETLSVEGSQKIFQPRVVAENDFSVRYMGPQQNVQIINGVVSATTAYSYKLRPKRAGDLQTPEFLIKTDQGEFQVVPQRVTVTESDSPDQNEDDEFVKVKSSVSKESVLIGEQIIDTLEIETSVALQNVSLEEDTPSGLLSESLTPDEQDQSVHGGKTFTVLRKRKVLFPLRTGTLEIPSKRLSASAIFRRSPSNLPFADPFGGGMFGNFFPEPQTIEKNIPVKKISVLDLPPAPSDADFWKIHPLVGETKLSLAFDPKTIDPGETKRVEISIMTTGNVKGLSEIPLPNLPNVKIYPEAPTLTHQVNQGKVYYTKTFKYSIVPTSGGNIIIPPLTLWYFNPDAPGYEQAKTEESIISVTGVAEPTATPLPKNANTPEPTIVPTTLESSFVSRHLWKILSGLFALIGIIGGLYGARKSRSKAPPQIIFIWTYDSASNAKEILEIFYENVEKISGEKAPTRYTLLELPLPKELEDDIETFLNICEEAIYGKKELSSAQLEELKITAKILTESIKRHTV